MLIHRRYCICRNWKYEKTSVYYFLIVLTSLYFSLTFFLHVFLIFHFFLLFPSFFSHSIHSRLLCFPTFFFPFLIYLFFYFILIDLFSFFILFYPLIFVFFILLLIPLPLFITFLCWLSSSILLILYLLPPLTSLSILFLIHFSYFFNFRTFISPSSFLQRMSQECVIMKFKTTKINSSILDFWWCRRNFFINHCFSSTKKCLSFLCIWSECWGSGLWADTWVGNGEMYSGF